MPFYKAAASGRESGGGPRAGDGETPASARHSGRRHGSPSGARRGPRRNRTTGWARLVGVYADAEQRSCYRAALGAEVTLERVDAALDAILTFVRRQEAIFDYPGKRPAPQRQGAVYGWAQVLGAAGLAARRGSAGRLAEPSLEDVESQLADRVQRAADAVEALVPTAKTLLPNIKPDYRVPAVDGRAARPAGPGRRQRVLQGNGCGAARALRPEGSLRHAP